MTQTPPFSPDQFGDEASYPAQRIASEEDTTRTLTFASDNKYHNITLSAVAGEGGMGTQTAIENPDAVHELVTQLTGCPAAITGGGGSQLSSKVPYTLVRLNSAELIDLSDESDTDDPKTVRVYHTPIYPDTRCTRRKRKHEDTRYRVLGRYVLWLPRQYSDCLSIATTTKAYFNDTTQYLRARPHKRQQKQNTILSRFNELTPGDTLNTGEYATDLVVLSDVYETITKSNRSYRGKTTQTSVKSVTVANPRGKYYQVGLETNPTTSRTSNETVAMPSLHISRPQDTVVPPNTPFRSDTATSLNNITDGAESTIDHDPVQPDMKHERSPLPHSRVRTSLEALDGLGETTNTKLFKAAPPRVGVDAETVAYTVFTYGADPQDTPIEETNAAYHNESPKPESQQTHTSDTGGQAQLGQYISQDTDTQTTQITKNDYVGSNEDLPTTPFFECLRTADANVNTETLPPRLQPELFNTWSTTHPNTRLEYIARLFETDELSPSETVHLLTELFNTAANEDAWIEPVMLSDVYFLPLLQVRTEIITTLKTTPQWESILTRLEDRYLEK